jgi:hypothetical protein
VALVLPHVHIPLHLLPLPPLLLPSPSSTPPLLLMLCLNYGLELLPPCPHPPIGWFLPFPPWDLPWSLFFVLVPRTISGKMSLAMESFFVVGALSEPRGGARPPCFNDLPCETINELVWMIRK